MWSDPIVSELRSNGIEWGAQFGGDVNAMFAELRRLERESGVSSVVLHPRQPEGSRATVVPLPSNQPQNIDAPHQTS